MYPVLGLVSACPKWWSDKFSVVLKADLKDEAIQEARQSLRQLPGVKSAKVIRKQLVYVKLNASVDIETVIRSAEGVAGVMRLRGAQTPTPPPVVTSSSWTIRPGDLGSSLLSW